MGYKEVGREKFGGQQRPGVVYAIKKGRFAAFSLLL